MTGRIHLLKIGVMKRLGILGIAGVMVVLLGAATAEDETSNLKFVVIKDYSGKPVRNASVVMHPIDKEGKQKGGLQLKTGPDGRTGFEGVPYGKLRIQVLAQGFQTYGQDYDINQPTTEITIKLKRPQEQFSIYEDKPADSNKPAENKDPSKPETPAQSESPKY
jgi:hypothetical protein